MIKTIEINPDILAHELAKIITDKPEEWFVEEQRSDGGFYYPNWDTSEKKLRVFIREYLNC